MLQGCSNQAGRAQLAVARSLRLHGQLKDASEGQTMTAQAFDAVVLLDSVVSFPRPLVREPYPKAEDRAKGVVGPGKVGSHASSHGVGG